MLRQATTDNVVLRVVAARKAPPLENWSFPQLTALDVAGQVSALGLMVENQLDAASLVPKRLIPFDVATLEAAGAVPATSSDSATPGRLIAAYYAPSDDFQLTGRFVRSSPELRVTTNLRLFVRESGLNLQGALALASTAQRRFDFDFTVPAGWQVVDVRDEEQVPLGFDRYPTAGGGTRIHVRLARPITSGKVGRVNFEAESMPQGWLGDWSSRQVVFPTFAVLGATKDVGAIAVGVADDLALRAERITGLTPLDAAEKQNYGLTRDGGQLVYRYETTGYAATLAIDRTTPRATARTYSFFRIDPDLLTAHYELVYDVARARPQRLSFLLPDTTPAAIDVRGLDGQAIKETVSERVTGKPLRRWTAELADGRRGRTRIAVDFQQALPKAEPTSYVLPAIAAGGVEYQSGVVAVEGNSAFDVQVVRHPRKADVGELAEADYAIGRRLLGVFSFVGKADDVVIDITRRPAYPLPAALVQEASYVTLLAAGGESQTSASWQVRAKLPFLQIELPNSSKLWSTELDGKPLLPQRDGQRLLLSFPAAGTDGLRQLRIMYETPVARVAGLGRIELSAPRLAVYDNGSQTEVPVADLRWELYLPAGHRLLRSMGTVSPVPGQPGSRLAAWQVAGAAYWIGSGSFLPSFNPLRSHARSSAMAKTETKTEQPSSPNEKVSEAPSFAGTTRHAPSAGEKIPTMPPAAKGNRAPQAGSMQAPGAAPAPAAPPAPMGGMDDNDRANLADVLTVNKRAPDLQAGMRSLKIALQPSGDHVTFQSLGAEPVIDVVLVESQRLRAFAWLLGLVVLVVGIALIGRPARARATFLIAVWLAATLVPLVTGWFELAAVFNGAFYAACLLAVLYFLGWIVRGVAARRRRSSHSTAAAGIGLLLALLTAISSAAADEQAPASASTDETPPLKVPDDATILLYDKAQGLEVPKAQRLLVPYERYVELWNRANPDSKLSDKPLPADYAPAGAAFSTTLEDEHSLTVAGVLDFNVFVDDRTVDIPLPLGGCVLASALLDGKPAQLKVVRPGQAKAPPANAKSNDSEQGLLALAAVGHGHHRLEVTLRVKLKRLGGWRTASARLPALGPAALNLTIPEAHTELQLPTVPDRRSYETQKPGETVATVLDTSEYLNLQWRPRVDAGHVDATLEVTTSALVDVQEDGLRAAWDLSFAFSRMLRDKFVVEIPAGYLVDKIAGDNVRGWTAPDTARPERLEITLLRPASDHVRFTIYLSKRSRLGVTATTIEVPQINVEGASVHSGHLAIHRSPMLNLQTLKVTGATRSDFRQSELHKSAAVDAADRSPLGLVPYQCYAFSAVPFVVQMKIEPPESLVTAEVQSLWKVAERQRSLETRLLVSVRGQPRYKLQVAIPDDLHIERVAAPGNCDWSVAQAGGRRVLTVLFAAGQAETSVVISGLLGAAGPATELPLPRVELLDAARQEGELVVQADPGLNVEVANLERCQRVLLERTAHWLTAHQRQLARISLAYDQPDYSGLLRFSLRSPTVHGYTVTNVRVTDRTIEETILLDLTVRDAGVREVVFLLPESLRDATISVPLLRQKTIEPIAGPAGSRQVRVRLELQDAVMNQLRVLVEHNRLHTHDVQQAPIPVLKTGRTDGRFVAIESATRDEVVVDKAAELEPLLRGQQQWQLVARLLGGGNTQAYRVMPGAVAPQLTYRTRDQAAVETVGARIGLAETDLVVDASGAYRGVQTYHLYNSTEPFLEIELPAGAELWTAMIADEPARPAGSPGLPASHVRIPLVKNAAGDLDYALTLTYGGTLPRPGPIARLDFPLIHTLNINVELSNVRLYLPATYRWISFGGTMSEVQEEADLQAGTISYLTRMTERLSQTLNSADPFSKMRAKKSVGSLYSSADEYRSTPASEVANANLNVALSENVATLRQAQQQAQTVQTLPQGAEGADNRKNISEFYFSQSNASSLNVVGQAGGNFSGATSSLAGSETIQLPPVARQEPGQFDARWLQGNKLGGEGRGAFPSAPPAAPPAAMFQGQGQGTRGNQAESGNQPSLPKLAPFEGQQRRAGQPAAEKDLSQPQTTKADGDVLQRYQRRLEQEAQGGATTRARQDGKPAPRTAAPATTTPLATGLASLNVAIPRRGVVYRFTTPRGEVHITGRAISDTLATSVFRVAIVLIVAIIAILALRAVQGGWVARAFQSRLGCLLLVLLAIFSLVLKLTLIAVLLVFVGFLWLVLAATSPIAQAEPRLREHD